MTLSAPQRLTGKLTRLGDGMTIVRTLPSARRRSIGAWCFLDHFGPVDVSGQDGLRVGPHPHIGLQTVTWLLDGEILHRDSLGSVQIIRPGQLNLMTSGCGISHSEESPPGHPPGLHGAQLWIALPDAARFTEPTFAHHAELPVFTHDGLRISVLLGDVLGQVSPGKVFTPLMGAELFADATTQATLPLRADFEYGIQVLTGRLRVDDEVLEPGTLLYLEAGRAKLHLLAEAGHFLVGHGQRRLGVTSRRAGPVPPVVSTRLQPASTSSIRVALMRSFSSGIRRGSKLMGLSRAPLSHACSAGKPLSS